MYNCFNSVDTFSLNWFFCYFHEVLSLRPLPDYIKAKLHSETDIHYLVILDMILVIRMSKTRPAIYLEK